MSNGSSLQFVLPLYMTFFFIVFAVGKFVRMPKGRGLLFVLTLHMIIFLLLFASTLFMVFCCYYFSEICKHANREWFEGIHEGGKEHKSLQIESTVK